MVNNVFSGTIQAKGNDSVTINGQTYYVDQTSKLPMYMRYFQVGQFVECTLKNGMLTFIKDPNRVPRSQQQGGYQQGGYQQNPAPQQPNPGIAASLPFNQVGGGMPPAGANQNPVGMNVPKTSRDDYWFIKGQKDDVRQIEIRANGLMNTATAIVKNFHDVGAGRDNGLDISGYVNEVLQVTELLQQYSTMKVIEGGFDQPIPASTDLPGSPTFSLPNPQES